MRYKLLYDQNRKIPLYSAENRAQALVAVESAAEPLCVALFPSLKAEIGVLFRSALWGGLVTLEGLRAVGYYFGRILGWPLREILVELEDGRTEAVPLFFEETEENPIKTKICKQLFSSICLSTHFVSHSAVLFSPPYAFLLVESVEEKAVNFGALQGLRADREVGDIPICFAALDGEEMRIRAMLRENREILADDRICLSALAYFLETERAAYGKEYRALGGKYCVERSGAAVARRLLTHLG